MSKFGETPPVRGPLGTYRMLAPNAAVRVSPLCLGSMNFGNAWKDFMGACDQETAEGMMDFFVEQGGNFIDTANNYQSEESEKWIGEWMKKRDNRDQIVLATKYTTAYRAGHAQDEIIINTTGNGFKSMSMSVNHSLKKLQTDYIDLLYVHWWDYTCSIEEMMLGLNQLYLAGKVLYFGASDCPAWVVSKANQYARDHGLRPFVVYQGRWSAEYRDFERDIIPMCVSEGMGLAPWGALGGGNFKSDEQRKNSDGRNMGPAGDNAVKVSKVLEKIADKNQTQITSVALAYVRSKTPYVFPIVGGRKIEHLKGNIQALGLDLSAEDVKEIEGAIPFDVGFPQTMIPTDPTNNWLLNMAEKTEYVKPSQPIPPHKGEK